MTNNILRKRAFVPDDGNRNAKIVIVGEQPGRDEIIARRPFIGPSGDLLMSMLNQLGITRSDCYITNTIPDAEKAIGSYMKLGRSKAYLSADARKYVIHLREKIADINPDIVFALGNFALYALTEKFGITKWRGSPLKMMGTDINVMPTYHPSYTLDPAKKAWHNRFLIYEDFKRGLTIQTLLMQQANAEIIINPKTKQVFEFFAYVNDLGHRGEMVCHDIETIYYDTPDIAVSCFSVGVQNSAMCISFMNSQKLIFTPETEHNILTEYGKIIEDNKIVKLTQGGWYDYSVLYKLYEMTPRGELHDTMIMQRIAWPGFSRGLDMICSKDSPFAWYKGTLKEFNAKGANWNDFFRYSALDALAPLFAFPNLYTELQLRKNVDTYNRQRRLIEPLHHVQRDGFNVNHACMLDMIEEERTKKQEAINDFNTLTGGNISPDSSQQLTKYFLGKGVRIYRDRQTKRPTFDKVALSRMSRNKVAEADAIVCIRKSSKIISTYLKTKLIGPNGRITCQLDPAGTQWSRLSSKSDPTGSGMNLQNWPYELRAIIVPDENHFFAFQDLSQAENLLVAGLGNCLEMLEEFERPGGDVHSLTAKMIYFVLFGEQLEDPAAESPYGAGNTKYSWRKIGKFANHGFNYGWGYKNFALKYQLPEKLAKRIREIYYSTYPGVPDKYQKDVRNELHNTRTLVNLFGRHWYYRGMLDDDGYKKGYAFKPQSTVGDLINEWGLLYWFHDKYVRDILTVKLQIHDELVYQIRIPKTDADWKDIHGALHAMAASMSKPLTMPTGRKIVIPTDTVIGTSLNAAKHGAKLSRDFSVIELQQSLEGLYEKKM